MPNSTHEALREHMAKWHKSELKRGRAHNPFGDLDEMMRFLCERIDAVERDVAEWKART